MGVLTEKQLENISKHKYSGEDLSIFGKYVLSYYWNWAVTLLPRWLAPNLITLAGCLFVYVAHALLLWYSPNLSGAAPSWVYYVGALSVWMFQTLDALDGKQARRIQFIKPMGDLFDHGSDIVTFSFIVMSLGSVMRVETDSILLQIVCAVVIPSFFYHWEMRYTDNLRLGVINGPIEGLLLGICYYLISAVRGSEFWLQSLRDFAPYSFVPDIKLNVAAVYTQVAFTLLTVIPICQTVAAACRRQKRSFIAAVAADLGLLFLVSAPLVAWAIIHNHGALDVYKIAPLYAVTFACSDAQNRQLVARVSRTAPPLVSWMLVPSWLPLANTALGWMLGGTPPLHEVTAIAVSAVLCALLYSVYVIRVLNAVCEHLNIRMFSIRPLRPERGSSSGTR